MAALQERPRKTVEDFMKLPEGVLAELIEAEILMSPSPRERHQAAVGRIFARINAFLESQPIGRIYLAPFDVHLPSGDIVEPDLIFVSTARAAIIQDWIRGVPDLLIEVLSPENRERDRIVKRRLYAMNGVPEYWIVDPDERAIEVLGLEGDRYAPRGYFREPDTLVSPLLPGLNLGVRQVFGERT